MPRADELQWDDELAGPLRSIDHPVRRVPVDAVIARARRRARRRAWLGAAAVFVVTGVAAAAAPHSPIVRYVRDLLSRPHETSAQQRIAPQRAATVPMQTLRGVSFVPGTRVDIAFRAEQTTGALHVRIADAPSVQLSDDGNVAAYALTATGVTVDNGGSSATYTLVIPRSVARVRVTVGARTVLAKDGDEITTIGVRDAAGGYVVPMQTAHSPIP